MLEEGALFSLGSPKEGLYAVQYSGKPLWLYARDDCSVENLRGSFSACLDKKNDISGLVSTGWAAEVCSDLCPPITASWEIAAFYLPFLPDLKHIAKGRLIFPSLEDATIIDGWIKEFYREALSSEFNATGKFAIALIKGKKLYGLEVEGLGLAAMGMVIPVNADMGRLNLIYCPPSYRGRGFGKDIVAALAAKLQDWNQLPVLYARVENKIVMDMYKSLGFVEAGRLLELRF